MGHERVGVLPKTQRWREIVGLIASSSLSESDVSNIANRTTQNIRSRLRFMHTDEGVRAAFTFLVALAVTSRERQPRAELTTMGIRLPEDPTPLALARAAHSWVNSKTESLEYASIAQSAAGDAIAIWADAHKDPQTRLIEVTDHSLGLWYRASDGKGFCELTRIFFAKFTERYLNYFLERESSSALASIPERQEFGKQLEKHVDRVSKHAFETAKITQSFAAGWFNKYAKDGMPPDQAIERFLSTAFGKIGDELQREREAK